MERKRLLAIFLFFVFICLSLISVENLGWLRSIRRLTERATIPLKTALYRTEQRVRQIFSDQKIAELEKQVRSLQNQTLRLAVLEEENKALRKQLEAPLAPALKFLPAKTVGLARYLTLNKGEDDGVKAGMTVISENILVGKVLTTTPKTSQVILPTDPDSKIPARTLKTNARGLVAGEFGTKAVFDKVLQAENLEIDDLAVTTGEGGYTRDLLLGKIGKISKNEVDPLQKADIEPLLDYGKLVNVFLIQ